MSVFAMRHTIYKPLVHPKRAHMSKKNTQGEERDAKRTYKLHTHTSLYINSVEAIKRRGQRYC